MILESTIQEALLCILCFDPGVKGSKLVATLLPPAIYDVYYREVASAAHDYISRWKNCPGEHTLDLVETLKARRPESAAVYDKLYRSMLQTRDTINNEYILSRAIEFARFQRVKSTVAKVISAIDSDQPNAVDEAESLMSQCSKPFEGAATLTHGLLLNDPNQALQFLNTAHEPRFRCGVEVLDKFELGPARKESHLFMASSGRGKTWWGISCARNALIHDHARVLHVTLEMSEAKIAQRYLQAFFSIGLKESKSLAATVFTKDDTGRFIGYDEKLFKRRPSLRDENIVEILHDKMKPLLNRPRLYIKQFPTGQLTVKLLESYLAHLEASAQFIPDMIVLDYADLMDIDSRDYRHHVSKIHKDLRGIAIERNLALVNLTQVNREGSKAKRVSETHTAEDISKIHTADVVLSYSQTEGEYAMGCARLFVVKAREERRNMEVCIAQSYALGQFCIDSVRMNPQKYWPMLDDKIVDD